MSYIKLIHWKQEEANERVERLGGYGFEVDCETPQDNSALGALRANPPQAIVIDLNRLPAHGREFGMACRKKLANQALLPDATSPAVRDAHLVTLVGGCRHGRGSAQRKG